MNHPLFIWGLASLMTFAGSVVGIKVGMAKMEGRQNLMDAQQKRAREDLGHVIRRADVTEMLVHEIDRRVVKLESAKDRG